MKRVEIEKTPAGVFLIKVNGRIVRNPHSCPQGAATFATEEDAREWYEENKKGS
jgi:hypothetical protein